MKSGVAMDQCKHPGLRRSYRSEMYVDIVNWFLVDDSRRNINSSVCLGYNQS